MPDYDLKSIGENTTGPAADTEVLFGAANQGAATPVPYQFAGVKLWAQAWLKTWLPSVGFASNFIGGLVLSNDGTTPNSVLDIAAGSAMDSTNAVMISIGAWAKSTAGAWAAGSGSNGMGNGLTIAASTWYHVLLANNGGTPDIWFDTDAGGANRPAGISDAKARRVGSFKTDALSNIVPFVQTGSHFALKTPVHDVSAQALTAATPANVTLASVPSGVKVRPVANVSPTMSQAAAASITARLRVYSPNLPDSNNNNNVVTGMSLDASSATFTTATFWTEIGQEYTDTSQHLRAFTPDTGITLDVWTLGWIDDRGQ